MAQLSSCYFCGDALDASVDDYPVVPRRFDPAPDQQARVALCGDCRRKLERIMKSVVAAAPSDAGDATAERGSSTGAERDAGTDRTTSDTRGRTATDGDAGSQAESGRAGADADGGSVSPDDVPSAARDAGGDESWNVGEQPAAAEESAEAGATDAADADANESDDEAEGEPRRRYTDSQAAGKRAVRSGQVTGRTDTPDANTPATGADGGTKAADGAARDANGSADATASSDDDGTESGDGSSGATNADEEPQMTALEYNKVMRLLQNREFPVDREEFADVALNAYDVDRDEFDAILEAAVDRGLIAEENGVLLAGD